MSVTVDPATELEGPGFDLRECPDCGLFQHLPKLRPGLIADCPRCGAVLRHRRRNSFTVTWALMLTGLALFSVLLYAPLLGISVAGRQQGTTLPTLPIAFERFGMWELSVLVLLFTLIAPMMKLVLTSAVLIGIRSKQNPPIMSPATLAGMARVRAWLTPWAMTEVFLLGLFVAYTRLTAYATVTIGPALYAMGGLMLVMVAADAWLDEHAMWEAISRKRQPHPPGRGSAIGCDTCGLVTNAMPGDPCPCCDSNLRVRKPESLARCWALVAAAGALYIPANLMPVMTIVRLGRSQTSTILEGVQELIAYKMWPLALIVFVASVAVPVAKLFLLVLMLVKTQRGAGGNLRQRTQLYRIVDIIGRWSMIDVFMISILTALVRMGFLASVIPEAGAVCFAGVVILTMVAAASFDPRLMWDAAGQREPSPKLSGLPA